MAWLTVLCLLSVSWTIPSSLLCLVIYKYLCSKPPGHQSVLDLVIMEYLILSIIRNLVSVVYHYIGLNHAPIEPNLANFLYLILVTLSCLFFDSQNVLLGSLDQLISFI